MEQARPDGRNYNQLRPLVCSRGLLHRADGSARWSQENTIVVAAVYGPRDVPGRKQNAERAILEVVWKPKTGIAGTAEKEAESILRRTLEHIIISAMHPNTTISVIVQVVNDDGGLLGCAINASCAALVDAGIPLKGLVAAVTCSVDSNGEICLDPTKKEEKEHPSYACLVFPGHSKSVPSIPACTIDSEPMEHGIVSSVTRGVISADDYLNCLERGRAASSKVAEFARTSLERAQVNFAILRNAGKKYIFSWINSEVYTNWTEETIVFHRGVTTRVVGPLQGETIACHWHISTRGAGLWQGVGGCVPWFEVKIFWPAL